VQTAGAVLAVAPSRETKEEPYTAANKPWRGSGRFKSCPVRSIRLMSN
jgi:hypothetical protein